MSDSPAEPQHDKWFDWIAERRFGGSKAQRIRVMAQLMPVSHTVIERAAIRPGDTVLDVGTGDGLIGFGALSQVGDEGTVVFSDVSQDLLDSCRKRAAELGVEARCRFVAASADDLSVLAGGSVDVVTTRSVLMYVKDKAAALREFHRVLRPGGRMSLYEPIALPARVGTRHLLYDVAAFAGLAERVQAYLDAFDDPATSPMLDFDERDLLSFAERGGFGELRLDLLVKIGQATEATPWDVFVNTAPDPLVPTFAEAIAAALSPDEAAAFEEHLRPLVEEGRGERRTAVAYLSARKAS